MAVDRARGSGDILPKNPPRAPGPLILIFRKYVVDACFFFSGGSVMAIKRPRNRKDGSGGGKGGGRNTNRKPCPKGGPGKGGGGGKNRK